MSVAEELRQFKRRLLNAKPNIAPILGPDALEVFFCIARGQEPDETKAAAVLQGMPPDKFQENVKRAGARLSAVDELAAVELLVPQRNHWQSQVALGRTRLSEAITEANRIVLAAQAVLDESALKASALASEIAQRKSKALFTLQSTAAESIGERLREISGQVTDLENHIQAARSYNKRPTDSVRSEAQAAVAQLPDHICELKKSGLPADLRDAVMYGAKLAQAKATLKALTVQDALIAKAEAEINALHARGNEIANEKMIPENMELVGGAAGTVNLD